MNYATQPRFKPMQAGSTTKWCLGYANGITEGSGSWNTTSYNWTIDNGFTKSLWTNGASVVLGSGSLGAPGTITVASPVTAGSISNNGYSFAGSSVLTCTGNITSQTSMTIGCPISFTAASGATITANAGNTIATSSTLTAAGLFTMGSPCTYNLTGTNTFAGGILITDSASATCNIDSVIPALTLSGTNNVINIPSMSGTISSLNFVSAGTVNFTTRAISTYNITSITGVSGSNINIATGVGTAAAAINITSFAGYNGTVTAGINQSAGDGKITFQNLTAGIPSSVTLAISPNTTIYMLNTLTHSCNVVLSGGDTGESIGQFRMYPGCTLNGNITLAGNITSVADAFIGISNGTCTFNGGVFETGGARQFSKVGGGTVVMTTPISSTGGVRLQSGSLQCNIGTNAGTVNFFGSNPITANGGILLLSAGSTTNTMIWNNSITFGGAATFQVADARQVFAGPISVGAAVTMTQMFNNKGFTLSGAITGTGRTTLSAAASPSSSTIIAGNNATYSGGFTVNTAGYRLDINNAGALGTGTLILTSTQTLGNSSSGNITLSTNPAVTWNGNTTYTSTNNLIFGSGTWTMGAARTMTVSSTGGITIGGPIAGAFALTKAGTGPMTLKGASTFSGLFTASAGTTYVGNGVAFNGGTSPGVGTNAGLTVSSGASLISTVNFAIWGGQTNTRTVTNNGTVMMGAGLAEYMNGLTMTGGTLTAADGTAMWRTTSACAVTTNASATSSVISGLLDMTLGSLSFTVADGAVEKDLIVNSTITENTGAGSGAKNITKAGAGALYITNAANVYTGTTNINAGTLAGIGKTGTGLTTIATGATIQGGNGTGDTGTLTTGGALTLATGGLVRVTHSTSAVATVAVTGNLTFNSNAVTFDVTALNAGTYTLFTYTGTQSGTLAAPTLTSTGRTFGSYSYTGGVVSITLT